MQNDSIDNLRLDLNKKSVRGVIYVRSGDTRARTIHITLTNNGTVVDLADAVICELLILKPDGGMNDQTMVRYGNELQYTFRTADINVPGECKCQVMVTFNDAAVVTSSEFSVMVYQKEVDQELEKSTNEYTAITEILVEVQDLKNQADQDADRAETARTSIEGSEEACRQYAESAALDATSASESATSAESSAENAETSASNAQSYAESAETNMIETRENLAAVEEKAEEILGYDSSAQESAEDAAASATAASASETSASNYANASQTSAGNSANSALDSEAWAKGTRGGSDIPATDPAYNNHSKYWAEKAQEAATSFPTHLSSFVNDTGFIDNTVNDLVNYYTQSQTYTQAEVNALIAAINQMHLEIVSSLPTEDIDTHTIYFVPRSDPQTGDYYEEYIYINNAWEHIGNTQVDLSNYYTKSETDTLLSAKVADNPTFTEASTRANIASGESFATILGKIKKWFTDLKAVAFSGSYNDLDDKPTIPDISTKVSKSGDTMSGKLTVTDNSNEGIKIYRNHNSTTSQLSNITVGNEIANGTAGSCYGAVALFGKGNKYSLLQATNSTEHRTIELPDKSGTVALLSDSFPASQVSINIGSALTTLDEMLKFPFGNAGQTELGRFDVTYNNIKYEIAGIKVYINSKARYAIFGSVLSGSYGAGKFAIYNSWQNTFILINPGTVPAVNKYSVTLSSSTNVDTITNSSINGTVTVIGMYINGVSAGTSMMSHFTEIKYVSSNKLQITRDNRASYAGASLTLLCVNSDTL